MVLGVYQVCLEEDMYNVFSLPSPCLSFGWFALVVLAPPYYAAVQETRSQYFCCAKLSGATLDGRYCVNFFCCPVW